MNTERIAIKTSTGDLFVVGKGEAFERWDQVTRREDGATFSVYRLDGPAQQAEINANYIVSVRRFKP